MVALEHKTHLPGFRPVPKTGVIYVMSEAAKEGFSYESSEWVNLGQGAPEIGEIPDCPPRIENVDVGIDNFEYAPVGGMMELRDAVAQLYNKRYRKGKKSQYSAENVCICAGGRLALTRVVSTLGRVHVGHFLPDYTAYEELLDSFSSFIPIPINLSVQKEYKLTSEELKDKILGLGLSSVLFSNPCNPTGSVIKGDQLQAWTEVARDLSTSLIVDEFYSHYVYDYRPSSICEYIEDIEKEAVIVLDGLTKNWRYPGLRLSWTLGPKDVIEATSSAGSFIDGGCCKAVQRAAIKLVDPSWADKEATSIINHFEGKKEFMTSELKKLGFKFDLEPEAGFYCWCDLSDLPQGFNSGIDFFQKMLKHKVITVPGEFFDINPGKRRSERPSRFANYSRISFGPSMEELTQGIERIKKALS